MRAHSTFSVCSPTSFWFRFFSRFRCRFCCFRFAWWWWWCSFGDCACALLLRGRRSAHTQANARRLGGARVRVRVHCPLTNLCVFSSSTARLSFHTRPISRARRCFHLSVLSRLKHPTSSFTIIIIITLAHHQVLAAECSALSLLLARLRAHTPLFAPFSRVSELYLHNCPFFGAQFLFFVAHALSLAPQAKGFCSRQQKKTLSTILFPRLPSSQNHHTSWGS